MKHINITSALNYSASATEHKKDDEASSVRKWWPYLDAARATAALLVMLSHLRAFIFVDFQSVAHPGPLWSGFYFVTSFGHEAVMIFFVLSGFLVGGAIIDRAKNEKWSWIEYAITRMTRLWIVLIPALLLTAFWDNLGIVITGSRFYNGEMSGFYDSGPTGPPSYNTATFFGNLTFLQTVSVPTFGSNGPLWSLANEFWYYALFPLLFCSIAAPKVHSIVRLSCAAITVMICYVLPLELVVYGIIWLFGVAAFTLQGSIAFKRIPRNIFLVMSGVLLATALAAYRMKVSSEISDLAIGAAFAAMLLPLGQMTMASPILAKLSQVGAQFSYTLYLVHFPFAAFLACCVLSNRRLMPDLASGAIFAVFVVFAILYSFGVYLLFERNTGAARKGVLRFVTHFFDVNNQRSANKASDVPG